MDGGVPLIEELPDGYDVSEAPAASKGAMKKGFFNKPPKAVARKAAAPSPQEAPVAPLAPPPTAESKESLAVAEDLPGDLQEESPEELPGELQEDLEDLHSQLQSLVELAHGCRDTQGHVSKEVNTEVTKLKKAMASIQLDRWPPGSAKSARDRALRETDGALAELRGASNDARRHRHGDEKKAYSELRRSGDEATDRVKKLAELVQPSRADAATATRLATQSFHGLPLTAKLRVLADEKVAIATLLLTFLLGAAVMSGILFKIYGAWGCGFKCER